YQPIQMFVTQKNGKHPYSVINGIITNATKQGFFIHTASKIDKGNLFFTYKDATSNATLIFECEVLRTELNGIAVSYTLLSDSDHEQPDYLYEGNPLSISKGRFLNRFI
ncbi:MAG: hypothetical protein WBY88_14415, partial [Desulfosarcina sp.]